MGDFYSYNNEVEEQEEAIKLPPSVEQMLNQICKNQRQNLPDKKVRRLLLSIGEEGSLDILSEISVSQIKKTLSGFIVFMAKKYYQSETQQFYQQQPTQVSSAESFFQSPQIQRISLSSPNSSSSSINFSPRIGPLFQATVHNNVGDGSDSPTSAPQMLSPPMSPERTIFQRDLYDPTPSEFRNRAGIQGISEQLLALSNLEFRKLFLILHYIGRRKLEDVIMLHDVGDILDMTCQPMAHFESCIWTKYGHLCENVKRVQYLDWDSGRSHFYHCHVYSDGSYAFKGPYLKAERTHLQQSLGDENILVVRFMEEAPRCPQEIVKNGILVGLRRYRFFVYKDDGKKKNSMDKEEKIDTVKCYFVRMESLNPYENLTYILHNKIVHEARCRFMHVHMVPSMAKYMARFSLILSTTVKLQVDLNSVNIDRIEDIYCHDKNGRTLYDEDGKPLIHTDGTGYISEDLARKCPQDFFNVKYKNAKLERYPNGVELGESSSELGEAEFQSGEPPLLMQCRLFYNGLAVKGTLLVNRKLPRGTIQIRPSMIKVEADPKLSRARMFNSLEIVTPSFKPRNTYLSRTLIALLTYGGVPGEYFFDILNNTLEETQRLYSDEVTALKVAANHRDRDDASIATGMIMAGVPLCEPYLRCCLSSLAKEERNGLKGGKLPISDTFYLMGTADPTDTLNPHEVCVILEHGQISGEVLVYRNPGLHFGDIHRLLAVPVKNLGDVVGNAKYGILFSTKGPRSAATEIANGDFDGDKYWVSQNPQLLKYYRASRPWSRIHSTPKTLHREPNDFSAEEMEHELFQTFLETRMPNYSMADASSSWLALVDRLLILRKNYTTENEETKTMKEKLFELTDLYYDAIDAPKSGNKVYIPKRLKVDKFPHFLEKKAEYISTSVLGEIYDRVKSFKAEEAAAVEIKKLPAFEVKIPETCLRLWEERYKKYRFEMMQALNTSSESKNDLADEVVKKYKQLLYEATDMEESARSTTDIFNDALAIYRVTYDYAKAIGDVKKCGFAWKVAGSALCRLHAELHAKEHNQKVMAVSPSILHKLLNLRNKEVSNM
ncbi:probable RNA-dependent RNA polymerase 5 isoform X4 [Nicotiana tomentosiformis]|uniref:probable RNA-dependent RNA polymerase 5 isoform X4 n=1 Tax=Nicotiana tomentosiformis TaxID=4098 RepID=UPI00051AB2D1|nr:probable RNA-dependent RNA polymerase 5 isoform X2 [Nicotiana tomentosiformis]